MKRTLKLQYPLMLICIALLSVAVFLISYNNDNKYTYKGFPANEGTMTINMEDYENDPLFFLTHGWEFYQYKLLTPSELENHTPDAIITLGQYSDFSLGDKTANPFGDGTYRLTILTDNLSRDYALELTEIYTSYDIWINGELKASYGMDDTQQTINSITTFHAADSIEIVVAVTNQSHFYSGMTYPPAFGNPTTVYQQRSTAVLIRGIVCVVALLIGLFCFVIGLKYNQDALFLSLLCLCFIGYISYPIIHTLGLRGEAWYHIERTCLYAMYAVIILLQGRLCNIPTKVYRTATALAVLFAAFSLGFHLVHPSSGVVRMFYSSVVTTWKWLVAVYLLIVAVYAISKGNVKAKAILTGVVVFAASLVVDRMYPWFEPILFGWHGEIAGFVLVLIITGIMMRDTITAYGAAQRLPTTERELELALARCEELSAKPEVPKLTDLPLTPREMEVAALLLSNKTRAEISALLEVSIGTVNTLCTRIYRKVGCSSLREFKKMLNLGEK